MAYKRSMVSIMAIALVLLLWGQMAVNSLAAGAKTDTAEAEVLRLSERNAGENVAFGVEDMYPGDKLVQKYRVEVVFTDTATVSFQAVVRSGYEKLSEVLELTVKRTDTEEVLYEGLLRDMPEVDQVLTANGKSRQEICYEITAGLDTSVGNVYQKQKLVADFNWCMTVNQDSQEKEEGSQETEDDSQQGDLVGEEEQVETPPTGDDSHMTVWIVAILLSLLGLAYLIIRQRKGKGNKSRVKLLGSVIGIVFLITALGITTLALINYKVSVEENVFETGEISINLNDDKPIMAESLLFEPGMTVVRDFFVENDGTCDTYYKLYFDDIDGELAKVLEVTIKEDDVLYHGILADMTRDNVATVEEVLKVGEDRELEVWFHFPEKSGNQVQDLEVVFNICVEAVQAVNNPDRLFD